MAESSTSFKKGTSGNPSGKSKTKWLTDALRLELTQDPARAKRIADKIISMAEEGDLQAANIIFDRLEGKPVQAIELDATVSTLSPEERMARLIALQNRIAAVIDITPTPSREASPRETSVPSMIQGSKPDVSH